MSTTTHPNAKVQAAVRILEARGFAVTLLEEPSTYTPDTTYVVVKAVKDQGGLFTETTIQVQYAVRPRSTAFIGGHRFTFGATRPIRSYRDLQVYSY